MKQVIIAVEGFDGSGKGFVANYISELLPGSTIIPKDEGGVPALLTGIIQRSGPFCGSTHSEENDVVTRVCRDAARMQVAQERNPAAVVFDRFLCSTLGYAGVYGVQGMDEICRVLGSGVLCTIWCNCDFDIAWRRVQERASAGRQDLSRKERQGSAWVKKVGEACYAAFCSRPYAGKFLEITTEANIEETKFHLRNLVQEFV